MVGHLGAVRILAAAEATAQSPSPEFIIRGIMRAYCERFHTPLHIVESLPLYDVLQHHYEALYSDAVANDDAQAQEAFRVELERLSLDDYGLKQLMERKAREAAADMAFQKLVEAEIANQPPPAPPEMPKPLSQRVFGAEEVVTDMKFATDEQMMAWEGDPGIKPLR